MAPRAAFSNSEDAALQKRSAAPTAFRSSFPARATRWPGIVCSSEQVGDGEGLLDRPDDAPPRASRIMRLDERSHEVQCNPRD